MEVKKESKYIFIEIIRIIAAFLVIVNHTNSDIFLNRGISITWFLSLGYFFVSKIAVPLFVIVSGYLMLGKVDSYSKCMKRVMRMIMVLVLFSLPYYIDAIGISTFHPLEYLKSLVGNSVTTAFWYIYFYIGVLLMLPFLQRFFNALEKKDIHIFLVMSALFSCLWPILVHYFPRLSLFGSFQVPIFGTYIALLFLGGYFRKYGVPKISVIWYVVVFCTCLAFNIIMTYFEYQKNSGWYLFLDNREYLPIVLQSVCVFAIVSRFTISEKLAPIVKVIGGCTFGIYLLSDFFIDKLRFICDELCTNGIYPVLAVIIFEIIVFGLGLVATYIMKQIPGLKNII